jgi:TetR/AcrR family transcriptional regulator, cholesterol catabolism regulator
VGRATRPRPLSARRLEILKSAAAAFRRRGYHGASVGEIARALRMTKGNLYYYFRDKEEILYVLHDWSLDLLLERLREVERSEAPAAQKLRQLVQSFAQMIIDELHGTALTMDLQALSPARLRKVIAKRDRFDRGLRDLVREGMDTGAFARGDPKLAAFAVLGAVNWIPRWYDPRGPAGSLEIGATFADLVLDGLRKRR